MFNGVVRAQLSSDNADAAIESVVSRYESRHLPVIWWVGPLTTPASLGENLEMHGFTLMDEVPGMAVDLLALNEEVQTPPGLTIEQVTDVETLRQFCHVANVAFKFPDFVEDAYLEWLTSVGLDAEGLVRHYLGWLKGEPVATMSLFLESGVAGIEFTATAVHARRQGIAAAMTLTLLRKARSLGYRIGALCSSKMGVGLYRKVGFQEYCKQSGYIWGVDSEHSGEPTIAA